MVPEGWKYGTLSEGITLISGQHIEANQCNDMGLGTPYLTGPADFPNGQIVVSKYTEVPKVLCKRGDILLTVKGSGTGKSVIADGSYCISRQLAIRAVTLNPGFVSYILRSNETKYSDASAGLIPGITREDVLSTSFLIPPLEEQRKIAEILSTWDEAIEKLEKLIAAKQKRKRALMQGLLTGKKRFKEFEGQEWISTSLKSIARVVMGASPKSEAYNSNGQGLPLLQGNADIQNRRSAPRVWTTEVTKECFPNDILLSVRAPVGSVSLSLHHACIGRGLAAMSPMKSKTSQEFLYQYMLFLEPKWAKISQGSTFDSINSADLRDYEIYVPESLEEQQKIASVLSAADAEIETLQKQLQLYKQQKRGLMQVLLTGKKRAKVEEPPAATL
jgi:type I restriction enzyme, S subunit